MTENATYPTGTYVKDGRERIAWNVADAVALVFDGYSHKPADEDDASDEPEEVDEEADPEPDDEPDVETTFADDSPVRDFVIPSPSNLFT